MGWCNYQNSDGNCEHTDEKGINICDGLSKPQLFVLKKGSPENKERTMRETLFDDWELKILVHLMIEFSAHFCFIQ